VLRLLGEAGDPWTTLIYGGPPVVAILGILLAALIRVQRTYPKMYQEPLELLQQQTDRQQTEIDGQREQIGTLNRHVRECDYVVGLLIASMQEAGLPIPAQAWRRRRETDQDD
jgi:hypothetical protein